MATKIKDLRLTDDIELAADTVTWSDVLDEDNMASDLATAVPTQQSVKAYVDSLTSRYYNDILLETGDSLLTEASYYLIL